MKIFHGTSKENKDKIILNGFKARECSDFGKAIYFSHDKEVCLTYGDEVIECTFSGRLLNLSTPAHFEIYKTISINKNIHQRIRELNFDALKDGYIIAVYNPKTLNWKEKILAKKQKLEDRLYQQQLKDNAKFANVGFGCNMRGYHKLKNMSFSKEDKIKEQLKEVNLRLSELI